MSKIVTCVDARNYNLTVGNEYEVEIDPQNENRYLLRNDRNLNSRYGTNLFEDVVEEPVIEKYPFDRILNEIQYNGDRSYSIRVSDNDIIEITHNTMGNYNERLNMSCGVSQINNITACYNNICHQIIRVNNRLDENIKLTNDEIRQITNRIYSKILLGMFNDCGRGAILASTNTNCNRFEDINEVMETFNVSTSRVHNPNSGNEIIIYVFNLEKGNNNDEVDQEEEDDEF